MAFNSSASARAWGTQIDTMSSSAPLLTPIQIMPTMLPNDIPETSFTTTHKEDKLPHHASVFVGSLPSNIDQGDLTRMLMEHLSEHTQVKNIKVVRDSKGGVCAFVQCEDADSAAGLIQTLHSGVPKPFLGRVLRYEPARAFRTLLVSYRMPTRFVRPGGVNHLNMSPYQSEVALELPHAMRIWKHSNSRFHSIVYNSDAIQAEENCDSTSSDICAAENAIFLKPLEFDEETLRKLVSYFGRLEKFSPLQVSKPDEETHSFDAGTHGANTAYTAYPQPHNAARASMMDQGCWEVKWEYRDACVSALMTLRRVPHLTVTWAHQPASPNQTFSPSYQPNSSPSYSLHVQHRDMFSQFSSSPNGSASTHLRCRPSKVSIEGTDASVPTTDQQLSPVASESAPKEVQSIQDSESDGAKKHDPLLETIEQMQDLDLADGQVGGNSLPLFKPDRDQAGLTSAATYENSSQEYPKENADISQDPDECGTQELYIPQTPALDKMSITPLTARSQFPITPISSAAEGHPNMYYDNFDAKEKATSFKGSRIDREIDPTTLFVGGLEMFGPGAWDEEKVKNFFARFGGLESVKLVRPLNSCSAFAFVKFNNAEAPARAVFEEHNRVYEGRAMRVQLRDCNPPRVSWKYGHGRGRGRPHQTQFGPHRRFHYRPPYDGQEPIPLHLQTASMRQIPKDGDKISDIHLSTLTGPLPSISRPVQDECDVGTNSLPPPSSSDLSSAARQSPPTEKYREWYDEPESSTHTPEPSSLGSSVSMTGPLVSSSSSPYAFSVPHGPYVPPQPWVQSYLPQGPYQMPYYPGYPVYPPGLQPLHQAHAGPPSPEGSGPAVAQPGWPQMGMYTSYIPYPAVFPRPAAVDQGQMPQMSNQAPLIPTGFIQNEQGTLIPVYQPEALDQYMAGSGAGTSTPVTNHFPNIGPPRWGNASPYPYDPSNVQPNTFAPPNQGLNRPKNTGFSSTTSQHFSDFQASSATLHSSSDVSFNSPTPLYRRQGQRRESHQSHTSVRHYSHPRSYNGRVSRGHMYNSGQNQPSNLGHPAAPALPINNWNRWNGGR